MKHFLHLGWFKNILRWKYSWTCLEKFYRAFNFLNRVFAECKTGFYASKMQLLKERKKVPFYNRLPIKIKSLFSKTFSVKISTFEEKLKAQCVEISTFVSNSRVKISMKQLIYFLCVCFLMKCVQQSEMNFVPRIFFSLCSLSDLSTRKFKLQKSLISSSVCKQKRNPWIKGDHVSFLIPIFPALIFLWERSNRNDLRRKKLYVNLWESLAH